VKFKNTTSESNVGGLITIHLQQLHLCTKSGAGECLISNMQSKCCFIWRMLHLPCTATTWLC